MYTIGLMIIKNKLKPNNFFINSKKNFMLYNIGSYKYKVLKIFIFNNKISVDSCFILTRRS